MRNKQFPKNATQCSGAKYIYRLQNSSNAIYGQIDNNILLKRFTLLVLGKGREQKKGGNHFLQVLRGDNNRMGK